MAGRDRDRTGGRGRATTAVLAAACVVAVGFGLGACTPEEEPTPSETTSSVTEEPSTETPSPSPTETPTLTEEEVNVEAAKQTVIDYSAAVDAVGAANFVGWQEALVKYWGTVDLANYWGNIYSQAEADGLRTEGAVTLDNVRGTTPDPGPNSGSAEVLVSYCEDNAPLSIFLSDGSTLPKTGAPRVRWDTRLELREGGTWVFTEMTQASDAPC